MRRVFHLQVLMRVVRLGAMAGALLAAATGLAENAAPLIAISPSSVSANAVEQGEPWRVSVMLRADGRGNGTVELAPATGGWTKAVNLELWPVKGTAAAAKAEPVSAESATTATLSRERIAGGLWRFSPEVMQSLAPGEYRLRSSLAISGGRGWTGEVRGSDLPVKIIAKRAGDDSERTANRAYDAVARNELQDAARLLDAALAKTPMDPVLLKARAVVSERAGDVFSAILCVNAVQAQKGKAIPGAHPDIESEAMRQRLNSALRTPTAPGASLPAWTALPPAVMTAIVESARKTPFVVPREKVTAPSTSAAAPAKPGSANAVRTEPPRAVTPAASVATGVAVSASQAGNAIEAALTKPGKPSAGVLVLAAELPEMKILAEAQGQWAAAAVAGTRYGTGTGYAAAQATGAPNVPRAGDNSNAWCHSGDSKKTEWLELEFPKPVRATEVRVRQTLNPGTIVKVEALEADGTSHVWWEGRDEAGRALSAGTIAWFAVRVPPTNYVVSRIKVTLDLSSRIGWKQIDAVQLVGE